MKNHYTDIFCECTAYSKHVDDLIKIWHNLFVIFCFSNYLQLYYYLAFRMFWFERHFVWTYSYVKKNLSYITYIYIVCIYGEFMHRTFSISYARTRMQYFEPFMHIVTVKENGTKRSITPLKKSNMPLPMKVIMHTCT